MTAPFEQLEQTIGYVFRDRSLLERALTHKSYRFERPSSEPGVLGDNEQLEFLGDAVLGFLVSEKLVELFRPCPKADCPSAKRTLSAPSGCTKPPGT